MKLRSLRLKWIPRERQRCWTYICGSAGDVRWREFGPIQIRWQVSA